MPKGIYKHKQTQGFQKGHRLNAGRKHPKEVREKVANAKMGILNPNFGKHSANYKGGYVTLDGYKVLHFKKTKILEHRLVVEQIIGRSLTPEEEVHHRNTNRSDNEPKNLMAFVSMSAHRRFELNGQIKKEEIVFDGREAS